MNPGTVIAKRFVKDYMFAHHLKPQTIEITSSTVKVFREAHVKNRLNLEKEKTMSFE